MANNWNHDRAVDHISKRIDDVEEVTIKEYVRDMSLENIQTNQAYKVDGVHLYVDILNMSEILGTTKTEGVVSHQRTLRFLNQHVRAVSRLLAETDVKLVDFHNQRLHALVTKPYNSEDGAELAKVQQAVAVGQLMIDVLHETGDDDQQIPNAVVRVGMDTGVALAVNNGRGGYREPLFLGEPANHAAKHAAGDAPGIYLTGAARRVLALPEVAETKETCLTTTQIAACQEAADLNVTRESIVEEWSADLSENPIGDFTFSRQTPPLRDMDIESLTPANSKRQDAVSVYADIDGFTAFVAKHIQSDPENVVRALHVIRAELERVVTADFGGRRIRFIGDCVHALLCEGTAQTTDAAETVRTSVLCAAGLRSSFDEALVQLNRRGTATSGLGLSIGFEYGPMAVTRLGIHGKRIRCAMGRGVLQSEEEQKRCDGTETGIGNSAFDNAADKVRGLFGKGRIRAKLNYVEAIEELADVGEEAAEKARSMAYGPAVVGSTPRPHIHRSSLRP